MPDKTLYRFRGALRPGTDVHRASVLTPSTEGATATLRLYDPIDSWGGEWGVSAKEVATALHALGSDVQEIRVHINSPGGEVFEGIAIMNLLRSHSARVVAIVDGIAASAASFIACSADEVVMGRNSQLMIHDAWGLCVGNAQGMHAMGDVLDKISDNIAAVYSEKTGQSVPTCREWMLAESWYTADEAVTAGLADRIDEAAEAENHHDLSVFQYAGREQAPKPAAQPAVEADPPAPTLEGMRLRGALKAKR